MIANNAGNNTGNDGILLSNNGPQLIAAESKFRAHVKAMRIRLVDLFADFDKLRSGYITAAQFRRGIGAAFDKGVVRPLTAEESELIVQNYLKKNGMIKWRDFVDSIEKAFGGKLLEITPIKSNATDACLVGHVLSPRSETILEEVIDRLRSYVKHHGYDVKSWFKDFDKYNNGYVTYNQFRRGIPQNLLSMEEEDILLLRYGEDVTSTVNYFKMNVDVNRKAPKPQVDAAQLVAKLKVDAEYEHEFVPVGTEDLLHANVINHAQGKRTLYFVEDKIKKYVYKNRIRLLEFFRDYDRHNCGLVSEAQFLAGLRLSSLPLEDPDITVLKSTYQKDGRFQYRVFCASIDKVFTVNHLEAEPLIDVKPPPREWLIQGSNELPPDEEKRCNEIISKFRALMSERRLLLAPFFKDFDRGNLGRVTRSHFSRLLSMMKMDISDPDLHIIFKKYEDRSLGKVSYMNFIRDIDPQTYKHNSKSEIQQDISSGKGKVKDQPSSVDVAEIIKKIQRHVGSTRIRVAEFFRDFDRLRSYSIPRQEFIRGVDNIECSLTMAEFDTLADHYQDDKKKGFCRWKEFEIEVEKIFGDTNLESRPSHIPNPVNIMGKSSSSANSLSSKEAKLLNQTLANIREHLRIRQSSIKPFFKDFDKVCTSTGHVTLSQFRRCLQYMQVNVSNEEFEVLCKKYDDPMFNQMEKTDHKGYIQKCGEIISYLGFLEDLDLGIDEELRESFNRDSNKGSSKLVPKQKAEVQAPTMKYLTSDECDQLMHRLKTKVKTERIRVIDFLADFDHWRRGNITKNKFRRGLKVIFSNLTEPELTALEKKYETNAEEVNYVQFSDEIESVFTVKGLVKNPTCEVKEFIPGEVDPSLNILSAKDQKVYQKIMDRMVEIVRKHVIDPLTYLEDYDFINEGTISTNQFRSVLDDVGLPVDDEEIIVLAHRFATTKGMDRVNYRSFAAALMECAGL